MLKYCLDYIGLPQSYEGIIGLPVITLAEFEKGTYQEYILRVDYRDSIPTHRHKYLLLDMSEFHGQRITNSFWAEIIIIDRSGYKKCKGYNFGYPHSELNRSLEELTNWTVWEKCSIPELQTNKLLIYSRKCGRGTPGILHKKLNHVYGILEIQKNQIQLIRDLLEVNNTNENDLKNIAESNRKLLEENAKLRCISGVVSLPFLAEICNPPVLRRSFTNQSIHANSWVTHYLDQTQKLI